MTSTDAVLAALDPRLVVEYTRELVRRPSVNPPGNYSDVAPWVESQMRAIGLEVVTLEGQPGRTNVVGKLPGAGGGSSLCLAGHTDVVSIGERASWQVDPFAAEIVDGVMWGRGTADSKGMLAGMMAAVKAIKDSGLRLGGDLYLVAYVDDETAGKFGLGHVFDRGALQAQNLVLGEATSFEIQRIFKGRIWFGLTVKGQSAHGAFPERGHNAIDGAHRLMETIRAIPLNDHPMLGRDTVSVGMIRGGEQVNVVCGECETWFDVRWGPPRSSGDIREAVALGARRFQEENPAYSVGEMVAIEERDPLEFTSESPLIQVLQAAGGRVLGRDVGLGGWYSSGELWPVWRGRHIQNGAVIGPGEPWQAHAVNEHIPVEDLVDGARIYAAAAVAVCE
jgi:succinyl-diaminopimelate desuccinylase